MNGKTSLFAALLASLTIGAFSYWFYNHTEEKKLHQTIANQQLIEQELKIAESLLHRQHPLRAMHILKQPPLSTSEDPLIQQEKMRLTLNAAALLGDVTILLELFQKDPALFAHKEGAALQLAPRLLLTGDYGAFHRLVQPFLEKPKRSQEWILLQADALALQEKPQEAIQLLEKSRLTGENETMRQLRLALLAENEHPKVAFEKLTQAMKQQPANSDLHYYRAQLLEHGGKNDLASVELQQAAQTSPESPFYKQELVEHYLKTGKLQSAYKTLQHLHLGASSSTIWIDALFLDKVFKPFPTRFDSRNVPQDRETPLLRYLLAIDRSEYWDDRAIQTQPLVMKLAAQSPEALWLHVLDLLKTDQEREALTLLQEQPSMSTLNPILYQSLETLLSYRLNMENQEQTTDNLKELIAADTHPFIQTLAHPPYNEELNALIYSDAAISALFLAVNWNEAAIRLNSQHAIPTNLPKWVAFSFTKALKANRGIETALAFAQSQPHNPQLEFLIDEILLHQGKSDTATSSLKLLAMNKGKLGEQAAKLLSDYYISHSQWEKTAEAVNLNPAFAQTLEGKERLARAYIKMQNYQTGEALYQSILDQSDEAKSYFALKYYRTKNYKQAITLTKELIQKYPYREDLQVQLQKISQAASNP